MFAAKLLCAGVQTGAAGGKTTLALHVALTVDDAVKLTEKPGLMPVPVKVIGILMLRGVPPN